MKKIYGLLLVTLIASSTSQMKAANPEDVHFVRGWSTNRVNNRDLSGEGLRKVDLSGIWLKKANFRGADLTRVNFTGAMLEGAVLDGADVAGANFDRANVYGASFRGVKNLGKAKVRGASGEAAIMAKLEAKGAKF